MNIASINSVSVKNSPQYQSNRNQANVAFGIKFHTSWDGFLKDVGGRAEKTIKSKILKKLGYKTPVEKLKAKIEQLKKHQDNITCSIRPSEQTDGDGGFYLEDLMPIVSFYHEGEAGMIHEPITGVNVITNACQREFGGLFTSSNGLMKEITKFFDNPDGLVKMAEKEIAKIKSKKQA